MSLAHVSDTRLEDAFSPSVYDRDLLESRYVSVVQIFIDIHHRIIQALTLYVDGNRNVLRLYFIKLAVFLMISKTSSCQCRR